MNNIFTNDSFTIRDTPNKLYIKYIQNEYISNFELLGIFDDESSEWIFDKTNTNAISFINKILNLDIKTLYTVSNPQQILMNYASVSSSSVSASTSTASSSSVENKQYPFKLYDCTFECAISNIVYKILIADYNEKCISMHIQSTNPILSQIGKENKLFSTNYDESIKKNGGIFNFNLTSVKDEHTYPKIPGWCFSKNKDKKKLTEYLSFFLGNVNIFEDSNLYINKSKDLIQLLDFPLFSIKSITNGNIIYTYGPIAEINALEITGTIKFKCENLINKMIVYSV